MPLNPKVFDPTQKVIYPIYYGKPNLFTDVDLNLDSQIQRQTVEELWALTGVDFTNPFTPVLSYDGTGVLSYAISWGAFTIFTRSIQFSIGAGNFTGTSSPGYPGVRAYLVATRTLSMWPANAALNGVSGSSVPTPVASSDHYVYTGERLAFAQVPAGPVLAGGEEIICPVFSVIPARGAGGTTPQFYCLCLTDLQTELGALIGPNSINNTNLLELLRYTLDYRPLNNIICHLGMGAQGWFEDGSSANNLGSEGASEIGGFDWTDTLAHFFLPVFSVNIPGYTDTPPLYNPYFNITTGGAFGTSINVVANCKLRITARMPFFYNSATAIGYWDLLLVKTGATPFTNPEDLLSLTPGYSLPGSGMYDFKIDRIVNAVPGDAFTIRLNYTNGNIEPSTSNNIGFNLSTARLTVEVL